MRVCSLHFTENDYFNRAENSSKKRTLKRTAVPSQKLPMKIFQVSPGSSSTAEKEKKRIAMKEKVSNQQEISIDCEENGKASHSQEDIGAARGEDVEQNSKHLFEPSPDQNEKVLRNILQPNKKTQSAPRPDSNLDFDPLELNNLLLSTTSIFLGMCKELEMTTKMNENINYLYLDKESITLTTSKDQNEKELKNFIVNKHPLHPDETSLSDTTDKLDQIITDVENTMMLVDNDNPLRISKSSSMGTQTDNRILAMENKQLKLEIASLKSRISSLQKQIMRQEVPKLLFVRSESNLT
ncbi:hypothetical protein JTB14_028304 [Gonioctena quinquepunctata]|nr:hypothetical protein JTB14_028304 [Gonioctena quinquepunctata]